MAKRVGKWHLVPVLAVAICLGLAAAGYSQFISYPDRSRAVLEGNWQSCAESDGRYGERVYENTLPGIGPFELHLGPYHEFALFRGIREEHRDHTGSDNLLKPFNVEVVANRGLRTWEVPPLRLEVSLGGGSRNECESWFVTLRRLGPPTSD